MGLQERENARYPSIPFHAIRSISLFSSSVVSGILLYFAFQLRQDDYKIPWTFLIVLAASVFTLLFLMLTYIIRCCGVLSPFFNLLLNIPLLLLWIFAFSTFTYNIYGTLGHACDTTNWGNSRGITVCNVYKLLYSFMLFCCLAQPAQIVLDIRVNRERKALGVYDRMEEDSRRGVKLDTLDSNARHERAPEAQSGTEPYWNDERAQRNDGRGSMYGADGTSYNPDGSSYRGDETAYSRDESRHRADETTYSRAGSPYREDVTTYSRGGSPYRNYETSAPAHDFTYHAPRHAPSESTGYDSGQYAYSNRY